jgi:pimeloyl-ACP methyl ester carboxylesterase
MPTARVGDQELYYEEHGSGDPLLLIMGLAADSTAWFFQLPDFSAHYRTIVFDNRGVGRSTRPPGPYTIGQMADDAAGLLAALGIARAHVLGVSMGGMIAQELALRHPDRVRTLGLHCTAAGVDAYGGFLIDTLVAVKARGDREENVRAVMPWILCRKTMVERPEFIRFWIERALAYPYPIGLEGLSRQADAIRGHDTAARLGEIRVPTLITTGTEDILVPPVSSRDLHARIPGSELATIEDAGHLHFIEQASLFNGTCLEFLQKHRGA